MALDARLAAVPLQRDVTGHLQHVRLGIADLAEVPGPQQAQVGFLREIVHVDGRAGSPAHELEEIPVPALPSIQQ